MFHSPLVLVELDTPDLWVLNQPLMFSGSCGVITVPEGFITDLASIPHVVDWIPFLDRTGASRRPGALHDWLYAGMRSKGKDWCDALLREALMSEGLSHFEATAYYKAVQWFGKRAWEFDGNRHPYVNTGTSNLESCDFISEAAWQAWLATSPTPNEVHAP
jgi:hypothetical protein